MNESGVDIANEKLIRLNQQNDEINESLYLLSSLSFLSIRFI